MSDAAAADGLQQAQQARRDAERAFAVVFGEAGKRTAEQDLVWRHLAHWGFEDRPLIATFDVSRIASDAGAHDLWVQIKSFVARGALPDNPANRPTVGAIRDNQP